MKSTLLLFVALTFIHEARCFFPFLKNTEKDSDIDIGVKVIRGVPQNKQVNYESDSHQCDGGTKSYLSNEINDGYCDCVDGADEPGTSACSGNIFHCVNKGHRVNKIPSSRVDDGMSTYLLCKCFFIKRSGNRTDRAHQIYQECATAAMVLMKAT